MLSLWNKWKIPGLVYMDDITICSHTIKQHYADLIKKVNILQGVNMEIFLKI